MSDGKTKGSDSMAEDSEDELAGASRAFLEHLEKAGFFSQIKELEGNLQSIAGALKVLSDTTVERVQETENLVAHVLAIKAILTVMLKTSPVDSAAVSGLIKETTTASSDNGKGNPKVLAIAEGILSDNSG
jgi:acyl-CoA synthetase (NDP forming)